MNTERTGICRTCNNWQPPSSELSACSKGHFNLTGLIIECANHTGKNVRGPDRKPRKLRKRRPRKDITRVQLSLTPENANYLRQLPDENGNVINELLTDLRLRQRN